MTHILLVENDVDNQAVLMTMLQMAGYTATLAPDGQEGLRLAEELHPDLILMDMGMPILDGWEATKRIKAHPRLGRIPVIAVTSYAMTGDAKRALDAGCSDYLSKPIDYFVLIDKIRAQL